MLTITIPDQEFYDDNSNRFVTIKGATLTLEHSLIALSKWEEKWHVPFIDNKEITNEQMLDYIRCMTISPSNVDPKVYLCITKDNLDAIKTYLDDSHTATWFSDHKDAKTGMKGQNGMAITSELIYYWMTACQIPFECQKWNIKRLLTLIRICSEMNDPDKSKKMSKSEIYKSNAQLNALRRAQMKSKG